MKRQLLLTAVFAIVLSLVNAQTYNFTNSSAVGQFGPIQLLVNAEYTGTTLDGAVTVNTQGIQEWIVPTTGNYQITAIGACGGELQGAFFPGLPGTGATMQGEFLLTAGTTIYVVVGQKGIYNDNGSGGGGGSFIYTGTPGGAGLMIAAGGGGGHGHGSSNAPTGANGGGGGITAAQVNGVGGTGNGGSSGVGLGGNPGAGCSFSGAGAGGAGWTSDGGSPTTCGAATGGLFATFVGGFGGGDGLHGGFGGGGGADGNGSPGGGGGGYTGGGGGNTYNGDAWGAGAGAGSLNNGVSQVNVPGVTGAATGFTHGSVTIVFLCAPTSITPDIAALSDSSAECSLTLTSAPTATNDCGVVINGTPDVTFPVTTQGTTVVTWTYDDGSGNITTQTQNIILTDVTPPLADSTSLPDLSGCVSMNPAAPTATDNCTGTIIGVPDVTLPITAPGTTIITWSFTDPNGNTSTQTQNVLVNIVDINVTQVGAMLTSATSTASYQWLDCNGYTAISGETNQSYTPSMVGNYAVEITENGCVDTSACYLVDFAEIDILEEVGLTIYPNPSNGSFYLESTNNAIIYSVVITDNLGKTVYTSKTLQESITEIDLSHLQSGVYFVHVSGDFGIVIKELITQ